MFWNFKFELWLFDLNITNIRKFELWDNFITTINNVLLAEVLGNLCSIPCKGRHFAFTCQFQTCFRTGMKRTPVLLLIYLWSGVPLRTGTIYPLLANINWGHLLTLQWTAQKQGTGLLLFSNSLGPDQTQQFGVNTETCVQEVRDADVFVCVLLT